MEGYDIILEAGQSNADGYGHGPAPAYEPDPRILYLTAGTPAAADYYPQGEPAVCVACERPYPAGGEDDRLGDLALSFARKYVQEGCLAQGRKVLILRTAVGATGFYKGYWRVGDPLYQRMLAMTDHALSLSPRHRLVAMLWHQGEHEAAFGNDPALYRTQLGDMIRSVRQRYGLPGLPFICGGFCSQWAAENQPACDNITAAIRAVCGEVGGVFVSADDLPSNDQKTADGDTIHFCREALQELGRRYFRAYRQLERESLQERSTLMELKQGRPLSPEGRLPRELRVYDLLDRLGIDYQRVDHGPAMTMEACAEVDRALGTAMCKNLMLCNRQCTEFYILLTPGDKKFKTSLLSKQIGSSRLSFADGQYMEAFLDISPGSLSVLGLMNDHDRRVRLLIDRDVLAGEYIGVHPCVNTASLKLRTADLTQTIIPAMGHAPTLVELPWLE